MLEFCSKLTMKAFESVLEIQFRQRPGHQKIKQKEYALRSKNLNRDIEQSNIFDRCFLPGQRIDMSMIFHETLHRYSSSCPGCGVLHDEYKIIMKKEVRW